MVGGGPIGSTVARKVAEKGFKTLLCEEHESVGRPCHCTGKLTAHAFRDFDLPRETILNSVRAAVLHSPRSNELSIRRNVVDSYILDRESFDVRLAEMACSSGSHLSTQTRVYDLERASSGLMILKARRRGRVVLMKTRLVIDAEGATPILLKKAGLSPKSELLRGLQYEMADVELESSDCVELYFGREIAPGFFAWIVPITEGKARIGLCVSSAEATQPLQNYLEKFLRQLTSCGKIRDRRIEKTYAGFEPVGGPITRSYADNILVVGDSAGLVKSTSGGGLYFGLKAAEIAAQTSTKCLEKSDFSGRLLQGYEARWRKAIGRELRFTSIVRRLLDTLSDAQVDRIFEMIDEDEIREVIEAHGDTAFQSRLFRPVMLKFLEKSARKPSNIALLTELLFSGLKSFLA